MNKLKAQDNWKHRSLTMVCGTCMWFVASERETTTDIVVGRCRRRSPCQAVIGWPAIYSSDWCGDHKLDKT